MEKDASFLFGGISFNRKKFARDFDRFKGKNTVGSAEKLQLIEKEDKTVDNSLEETEFVENGKSEMEDETNTSVGKKRKRKEKGTASDSVDGFSIFKSSKSKKEAASEEVDQSVNELLQEKKEYYRQLERDAIFRKMHNIHVSGSNIPSPLHSFAELRSRYKCRSYLLRNLAELGFKEPTPIQRQAIPVLLSGRECFACAPTGSGKTFAFVFPILMKLKHTSKDGVRAVILSPTKELAAQTTRECRLLSVFAGIIMCKIVYQLTGAISPFFFTGYVKLDDQKKLEWNNRGFSTFHAVLVAAASLYLLLESDLFRDGAQDVLMINRTSTFSETILGMSTGYFLADLAMILYYFPDLGGTEYVLHHGLSMFAIVQALLSGQAQIYIFMVLFTESTTPFVNLRWYVDVAGQKNSQLYVCNGVALFLGWLVARILLFVFFFHHMFSHFDQIKEVYPLGFYSLLTVPPILALLNIVWFWKIAKGLIKTLRKARHSQ